MDWVYPAWNRKPIGFVSWGSQGGVRAVQQLREIAVELPLGVYTGAVQHTARRGL
ncbi:NADPH-dependent FMN reductase [Paraburkholderia azotifigens]|uniref:NADPH-dependent FMN reductase n=1 Tax=Paraburkholderia azotifigens TaxID=2057004 RepID=UPI003B8A8663